MWLLGNFQCLQTSKWISVFHLPCGVVHYITPPLGGLEGSMWPSVCCMHCVYVMILYPKRVLYYALVNKVSFTHYREEEAIKLDGLSVAEVKQLRDQSEKFAFQAEVNRMMKLIINSLYRNKEVWQWVGLLPMQVGHLIYYCVNT